MKIGRCLLVLLLVVLFVAAAASQNKTLAQRRQEVLDGKKRVRQPESSTTTVAPRTPSPKNSNAFDERLNKADHSLENNDGWEFMAKISTQLNWEQFLTPVPVSLGVLASLIASAGLTDDFRLDERTPAGGFRYMEHPDSFRRSLLQISHESYAAFLAAHTNMEKIRMSTLAAPAYMKEAVKILSSGRMSYIRNRFHRPLKVVKKMIDDNVIWSSEVANRFDRLANLTDEVHLTVISSNTEKTTLRSDLVSKQSESQLIAENLQQLLNNLGKQLNDDFAGQNRAIEDIGEAQRSIPTAIDGFFMDVAQFASEAFQGILSVVTLNFLSGDGRSADEAKLSEESGSSPSDQVTQPPADPCLYKHYSPIFTIFARSQTLWNQYPNVRSIDSSNGRYNATSDMKDYKFLLQNATECQPVKNVIEIGIDTILQLHQVANVQNVSAAINKDTSMADDDEKNKFEKWRTDEFNKVRRAMKGFNGEAKKLKKIVLTTQETKIFTGNISKPFSWTHTASEQQTANAHYKIAIHTEALRILRDAMERNWQLLNDKMEESIRVLNNMQSWKAEQMSVEKAIEMLQEGMNQLSELKKNWAQLVRFFVGMSNLIEAIVSKSLDDFTQQLATTVKSESFKKSGKLKVHVAKMIRDKTIKANQATTLIHRMASTYSRISTDYLMPRVHSLDAMMKFESPRDLIAERSQLTLSCAEDASKISQIVGEDMRKLVSKIEERAREVKREYGFLDELEHGAVLAFGFN